MSRAISLSGVRFSYRDVPVLDTVGFTLDEGCFCILEGANGAGKTTLLRIILGEEQPSSGSVEVFGNTPDAKHLGGLIGYVPQRAPEDYRRFPVTVLEFVRSGLYASVGAFMPYGAKQKRAAIEAIAQSGLKGYERRLMGELSGGQFQRALLARALVCAPRLLILDESTSNLDSHSVGVLVDSVAHAVRDTGAAALLVTHDVARIPRLFDRAVLLSGGAVHERELSSDDAGAGQDLGKADAAGGQGLSETDARSAQGSGEVSERSGQVSGEADVRPDQSSSRIPARSEQAPRKEDR